MKAFMFIPREVFEVVKTRILGTWFVDDEPILGHVKDEEDIVICSFTSDFHEDFDLVGKVVAGYGVVIYYDIPQAIKRT